MEKRGIEDWLSYIKDKDINLNDVAIDRLKQRGSSWQSLVILSRMLASDSFKEYEVALEIMEDIAKNHGADNEVSDSKTIEQKIWFLRDFGVLTWKVKEDAQKALEYLTQAVDILKSIDFELAFLIKGEVWKDKLDLLKITRQEDKAMEEANHIIADYEKSQDYINNSCLYNAYLLKAEVEKEANNLEKAVENLKLALRSFLLEKNQEKELEGIWAKCDEDYLKCYEEMLQFTQNDQDWDI